LEQLRANLEAHDAARARINECNVVVLAASLDVTVRSRFINEVLSSVDFAADITGRRVYFMSWLCGHLRIPESVNGLISACHHPQSSVRNCASEALGKVGCDLVAVTDCLETALSDNYYRTRFHAAWSLSELRSVRSLLRLAAAIRAEEVLDVRKEMLRVKDFLNTVAQPAPRVAS
jgi:hypothetical protein